MDDNYITSEVNAKVESIQDNSNVFDVGTVVKVNDFIIEVSGLDNVMFYEKINVIDKAIGYVNSIKEDVVVVALLKIFVPVNIGDKVSATNTLYTGSYSPDSVGRVIDLFGEDQLTSKTFENLIDIPIERPTIPIMDRTKVERPLLTGIAGIDLMYPIGKGQRQLILGDKRTGKTQIGLDTIVNQNGKNVMCFYVAIGKTKKEVKNIYYELMKRGAISYTTIITAFNDELPPVISLIPYFALSVCENYLMDGYDVLVVIDDLKRHAEAYREISLVSGKTPGRDAYPADIFYTHSRLLEKGCQHKNGGSITILPIVETKGGDITDYISTNIISITDGQIVLSSKSFQKGEKPAIDYGLSVSRLGGQVQDPSVKVIGNNVRRKLLSYLETRSVYELVNMDEMSQELKNQFMEGKIILSNLKQYKFSPLTPEAMIQMFSDFASKEEDKEKDEKKESDQSTEAVAEAAPAEGEKVEEAPTATVPLVDVNNIAGSEETPEPTAQNSEQTTQTVEEAPVYDSAVSVSSTEAVVETPTYAVPVVAMPTEAVLAEQTQVPYQETTNQATTVAPDSTQVAYVADPATYQMAAPQEVSTETVGYAVPTYATPVDNSTANAAPQEVSTETVGYTIPDYVTQEGYSTTYVAAPSDYSSSGSGYTVPTYAPVDNTVYQATAPTNTYAVDPASYGAAAMVTPDGYVAQVVADDPVSTEVPVIEQSETITDLPVIEESQTVTDLPVIEESQTVTDLPVIEESQTVTDLPVIEESQTVTDLPVIEESQTVTDLPVIEESQTVTDLPVIEESQTVTDLPVIEESQTVTDLPVIEESQTVTDLPVIEESQTVTDIPVLSSDTEEVLSDGKESPILEENTPDVVEVLISSDNTGLDM